MSPDAHLRRPSPRLATWPQLALGARRACHACKERTPCAQRADARGYHVTRCHAQWILRATPSPRDITPLPSGYNPLPSGYKALPLGIEYRARRAPDAPPRLGIAAAMSATWFGLGLGLGFGFGFGFGLGSGLGLGLGFG